MQTEVEICLAPVTEQRVWCTLVMLNEEYARGAIVVAKTLRILNTKYPIWCMVALGISDECIACLSEYFDRIVRVPLITHNVISMKSKKQNDIYKSWIHHSFTKWNIMDPQLFPVDKVILVDADMLFLQNCDELFDVAAPAATFSSPWAFPYHKKRGGLYNPYGEMKHGATVPHHKIRQGFRRSFLCPACMVLVHPTATSYKMMLDILTSSEYYGDKACVSGFDEQLLVSTWLATKQNIQHIHQRYNWLVGKPQWLLNNEKPMTQQYYNGKPWRENPTATQWDDVKQWHDIWQQVISETPAIADYFTS